MQKRVVEPQADEARAKTGEKVAVETRPDIPTHLVKWEGAEKGEDGVYRVAGEMRLTAEQFYTKADRDEPWNDTLSYTLSGKERDDIFLFAEAFRDKSESLKAAAQSSPYTEQNTFDTDDPAPNGTMYDSHGNPIPNGARDEILWLRGQAAGLREEIKRLKRGTMSQPSKSEELKNGLESIGIIWIEPTDLRNRVGKFLLDKGVKMGVKIDPGTVQNMMTEFTEAELTKLAEQEGK